MMSESVAKFNQLVNLVNALEPVAALKHVHAVHGSKYYGHQLGPVPVPMHEGMPRAKYANFYFDQHGQGTRTRF